MLSAVDKVKIAVFTYSFLLKIPPWRRLIRVLLQFIVLLVFSIHGNTAYAYTVKVVALGTDATKATASGAGNYNARAIVRVSVTPFDYNTVVSSWSPSFCASPFTMPSQNVTCYAQLTAAPRYSFSIRTTGTYGTGSTSGSTAAGSYPRGKPITLVAQAASDSIFAGWTPAICTSSFTMPAYNLVCTATFNQLPFYTLQVKINGRGKVTSNALRGLYDGQFQAGQVIDLKPELLENPSEWYFSGWTPAPCANSFKMPEQNLICTANFSALGYPFSVKTAGLGKGTVTGGTASGNYAAGTMISLGVPTPEPGSVFVGWSPEGCRKSSTGNIISSQGGTFAMPQNGLECTANFSVPAKLSVRVAGSGAGNFSVDRALIYSVNHYVSGLSDPKTIFRVKTGATQFNQDLVSGDYIRLIATPTDIKTDDIVWGNGSGSNIVVNSTFKGWSPSELCGNGSFDMPAQDVTCTATFDRPSYTLSTATAGSGTGSVAGTANGSYVSGTRVLLSPQAAPGSVFIRWEPTQPVLNEYWKDTITSLNGCSGSFKLYSNTVCTAYFEVGYAFNTVTDGTGTGTVTGTANGTYANGQTINLVATPTGNSVFTGWSAGCSNSFPMPAQNLTCTANFTATLPLNTATTGTGVGTVLVTADNFVEQYIYAVAGTDTQGYTGDGGLATDAQLKMASSLAFDNEGNLYIADTLNNRIRKIDTTGIINTVAGNGGWQESGDGGLAVNAGIPRPDSLAVDSNHNLYITDTYHPRIRKIDEAGIINTVVGTGTGYYSSGDGGLAINAELSEFVTSLAIDGNDNLYIADTNRVRKVDTQGIINTVAGGGSHYECSGSATDLEFSYIDQITFDREGNLYIINDGIKICKVDTTGFASTVFESQTGYVMSIALDDEGNLYIAEDSSYIGILKLDTKGVISTLAGNGSGNSGDGGPARKAGLSYITALAVNDGNLYLGLEANIRRIELLGNKGSTYYYLSGTPIRLTATPKKGSVFAGWNTSCTDTFTMPANELTCTATFNLENVSTSAEDNNAIPIEDSKAGIITSTCPKASLDNEFTLKIPCVKVNNLQYAAELHYMGKENNNPYWRLDSAINSNCIGDADSCALVNDELRVTLPNILINGLPTTVQLKPYLHPIFSEQLFWKYETASDATQ